MEKFDTQELERLLSKAQSYKRQAEDCSATYKSLQEHGGNAMLYIHTDDGYESKISLDVETVSKMLSVLHKQYKDHITETKKEVDKLYAAFE